MIYFNIEFCTTIKVNTDPQRRCYNGCHAKFELVKTPWEVLEREIPYAELKKRLGFWKDLNDFAVSQRGESAKKHFRAVPAS